MFKLRFVNLKKAMIRVNLQRHCIETELKRLHRRCVDRMLKTDTNPPEAEKTLQVLKDALECLDFPYLRAAFPELAGSRPVEANLSGTPDGCLKLTINHQIIDLTAYCKPTTPSPKG